MNESIQLAKLAHRNELNIPTKFKMSKRINSSNKIDIDK